MRSPHKLLFSRLNGPKFLSLFPQGRCSSPLRTFCPILMDPVCIGSCLLLSSMHPRWIYISQPLQPKPGCSNPAVAATGQSGRLRDSQPSPDRDNQPSIGFCTSAPSHLSNSSFSRLLQAPCPSPGRRILPSQSAWGSYPIEMGIRIPQRKFSSRNWTSKSIKCICKPQPQTV